MLQQKTSFYEGGLSRSWVQKLKDLILFTQRVYTRATRAVRKISKYIPECQTYIFVF